MSFQLFSNADCTKIAYDLNYFPLDFGDTPVNGMLCTIEPKSRSRIHNHFETEFFYFLSGSGVVHIGKEEVKITTGMGIRISPFSNHVVENRSENEPLRFISFYWENPKSEPEKLNDEKNTTTLIFSTPPTPNGDLHLGHLSGPYLAADVYRRYLTECGNIAFHATGRDDHQTYVVMKANVENKDPHILADTYANLIQKTLTAYGIQLNHFIEPNTEGAYAQFVKRIFLKLYEDGYIIEKTLPAAYGAESGRYLNEAFIRGKCPFCQCESDGNACEECGRPNNCVDLIEARERLSMKSVTTSPSKRLYFRMSLLADKLNEYIKSAPMSAHAFSLSQTMISDGLPDICVSNVSDWGVKIPLSNYEEQTLYVWFEMAAGYLWSSLNLAPAEISDEMEKIQWFYNKNKTKVVHFYGFDNTYYHTLLFPAVYFALGGLNPPAAHVVNELLDLEGSKFSTSRGHLIWGRDLLRTAPVDYIRWFLSEIRPEGLRSNFKLNTFSTSVNHLFFDSLKTWTDELSQKIKMEFNNIVPEAGAWTAEQRKFYNSLLLLRQRVLDSYAIENFSPRIVTSTLRDLVENGLRFQTSQLRFFQKKYVSDNLRTTLALSLLALKLFALLARPITPEIGNKLLRFMQLAETTCITDTTFISSKTVLDIAELPEFLELHEENILSILKNINSQLLTETR